MDLADFAKVIEGKHLVGSITMGPRGVAKIKLNPGEKAAGGMESEIAALLAQGSKPKPIVNSIPVPPIVHDAIAAGTVQASVDDPAFAEGELLKLCSGPNAG